MENSNSSDDNKYEGWLTKKGKIRKNWQRRWCVLEGGELKYYKQKPSNKKAKPAGSIPISGSSCGPTSSKDSKYANTFQIVTPKRTYHLYADSAEELNIWKAKILKNGGKWNDDEKSEHRKTFVEEDGSVVEPTDTKSVTTTETKQNLSISRNLTASRKQMASSGMYNPLLDGLNLGGNVSDLIGELRSMRQFGMVDENSRQSKLLDAFTFMQLLKAKESVELSFEQFADSEFTAFTAEEISSGTKDTDARWLPDGSFLQPKEDDIFSQVSNIDQVLPFAQSKIFSKKEMEPLLRTFLSIHSHNSRDNFYQSLKNRMLLIKSTYESLAARRRKQLKHEEEEESSLPTLAQVILTAASDLITGPLAQSTSKRTPESVAITASVLDTLLNSLRKFPILSLCENNELDKLTKKAVSKTLGWLVGILNSDDEKLITTQIRQKSLLVMIELALASGSVEIILVLVSQLAINQNKRIQACFPLPDVAARLRALNEFYPELGEEDTSSLGAVRLLWTWDNFNLVHTKGLESEQLIACQLKRTMTSDGMFLYVHDNFGLRKVGTGYHGTVKGRIYLVKEKYRSTDKIWMSFKAGKLYCHSADEESNNLFVLSCDSLNEIDSEKCSLESPKEPTTSKASKEEMENEEGNELSKQHVVIGDGWNFYVLKQYSVTCNLIVDVFDHNNKFIKRVPLLDAGGSPFKSIPAERFPLSSYITNGRHLMAVVPFAARESFQSPEECNVFTWNIDDGEMTDNSISIEIQDSRNGPILTSRAFFTSTFDVVNNILWTYLPYSKKMRAFETMGLSRQVLSLIYVTIQLIVLPTGSPLSIHEFLAANPTYNIPESEIGDKESLSALHVVIHLLGNAVRLGYFLRPSLEETGLPIFPPDEQRIELLEEVAFGVQKSVDTYQIIGDMLENLCNQYISGKTPLSPTNQWILISLLRLLRLNLHPLFESKKPFDLPTSLQEKFRAVLFKMMNTKPSSPSAIDKAVMNEVFQIIVMGLHVLYSSVTSQLEVIANLIDVSSQVKSSHVLGLQLEISDLWKWFLPTDLQSEDIEDEEEIDVEDLLDEPKPKGKKGKKEEKKKEEPAKPVIQEDPAAIEKLFLNLVQKLVNRITDFQLKNIQNREILGVVDPEIRILFTIQKQLLSCCIANKDVERCLKILTSYTSIILQKSKEFLQGVEKAGLIPVILEKVLENSIVSRLLPYLLVGYPTDSPITASSAVFNALVDFVAVLDEINAKNPTLQIILDEYAKTEAKEKKWKGTKKVKIPPQLPFLIDLEKIVAWSAGKISSAQIKGPAVTENETSCKPLLSFEMFSNGIHPDYLKNYSNGVNAIANKTNETKFLEELIKGEGSANALFHFVHKVIESKANKAPSLFPQSKQSEEVLTLERASVAALLRQLNLTLVAISHADSVQKDKDYNMEAPELLSIWNKAEKFRRWAQQESQKAGNESGDESLENTMIKNLTERAVFLTFMVDCAPTGSRNSVNLGAIANKWREQVQKQQQKKQNDLNWGTFFQIWKNRRQAVNKQEDFEKVANEVIAFLKDPNPLAAFVESTKLQIQRSTARIEGLKLIDSLLQKINLNYMKSDAVSNLASALRKTDVIEHKQSHSVLDDLETIGPEKTVEVLKYFNSLYTKLANILKDENVAVTTKVAVLDLYNLNFFKNEKFISEIKLPQVLITLYKQFPVQLDKKKEDRESEIASHLQEASWTCLRLLCMDSIKKKPSEDQKDLLQEISSILFKELQSMLPPLQSDILDKQMAIPQTHEDLCKRILLLLFSICKPVTFPMFGTPEWIVLLISIIRSASLACKLIAFRILRLLLPTQSHKSIVDYQKQQNPKTLSILQLLFQVIGIAFEASSDLCAPTIQSLINVATTHDVFTVASESMMLIRLLLNSESWKEQILTVIKESLDRLSDSFSSHGKLTRSRSRTVVTRETDTNWTALASLCILGGNRDTMRLGGRVILLSGNSTEESVEEFSGESQRDVLGTLIEFNRLQTTAKVIQDSHKEPIKLEVSKMSGTVEVSPDINLISDLKLISLLVKETETKHSRDTFFFQLRSSALKLLVEVLSSDSPALKEWVVKDGLVPHLVRLSLQSIGFEKVDITSEQLMELSQCLHEVLLSEKELANVSLSVTTKSSSINIEQRVQKLISLGFITDWEVNDARMAFSQLDLNGDGVLTPEEVIEASGIDPIDEEEMQLMREQLLRADRNKDGTIDFLEFVMMQAGLIDYSFPDEQSEESNKPMPIMQVHRPTLIAGSYAITLPPNKSLPTQAINGDLVFGYQKEIPREEIKGCVILLDSEKDDRPLSEQIKEYQALGAVAVIVVADKPISELANLEVGFPIVFLSRKSADSIRNGLSANSSQKPDDNSIAQTESADESELVTNLLLEIGYSEDQVKEAVKQGNNNLASAAGWLFKNVPDISPRSKRTLAEPNDNDESQDLPIRGKEEINEDEDEVLDDANDGDEELNNSRRLQRRGQVDLEAASMPEGSQPESKVNEKEDKGEPTYLSAFLTKETQTSSKQKKSFISQFDELNLSDLKGEVIRVERAISVQHAKQAVLCVLSKWPSNEPISCKQLGVDASALVKIFRFAVSDKVSRNGVKLEGILKVFVSLIEEDTVLAQELVQECLGIIHLESKLPDEMKAAAKLNLRFSLAVLQVALRSQKYPKKELISSKLVWELIQSLDRVSPLLRIDIAAVLTQLFLTIASVNDKPADLEEQLKVLQAILQKQFVQDRKKKFIVGSIYLQSIAELVAVGKSLIQKAEDVFKQLVEQTQRVEEEDSRVKLVPKTNQSEALEIGDDGTVSLTPEFSFVFPSVSTNKFLTSGKYFYETTIKMVEGFPGGRRVGKIIAQIGWVDKNFKADEIQGFGVGDDEHSWAYDGGRLRKWHKGRWSAFSKIEWKADDIVGCGVDLDNKKMEFYLNGVPLGEAFSGFEVGEGLSPAASFRGEQQLEFNFGRAPFQFPVPGYQAIEKQEIDPDAPFKLPDFDTYCRNFQLVEYLHSRKKLPEIVFQSARIQHEKMVEKVNNKIKLKISSCDGKSDAYNIAENILKDNHGYFSTDKAKNVNIIFTAEEHFVVKQLYLEAHRGYGVANPVKNAVVFITDEKPDLSQFSQFDNYTQEKWDAFMKDKNGVSTAPTDPVGYLQIQQGSINCTFKLTQPKKGKFILLKLLSSSSSSRMDVTFFSAMGLAGPFSPIQDTIGNADITSIACNNNTWSYEMDEQLATFMNTISQKLSTSPLSLSEGAILSKCTESEFIKLFPMIKNLKPEAILYRAHLLWYFNSELNSMLYWINLSNAVKEFSIASKLRALKGLIFLEVKTKFLHAVLDQTQNQGQPIQNLKLNRAKALQQRDGTAPKSDLETLFGQAFSQLNHVHPSAFRVTEQAWSVTYLGEGSIDAGGPYRDSLQQFCTEIQSEHLSLFQKSPNGQHNVGLNRELWVPVPSSKSSTQIGMYEFLGKLLGIALRTSYTLNLDFASVLYKPLVGDLVDIGDLKAIDQMCVQSLEALKNIDKQGITEETFEDVFLEVFTINGSDGKEVELKPNGKQIPVTFQNRFEWAELVEKKRTNEFKSQVDAIKRGMATIVPLAVLSLFTWPEIKISVEGKPTLDIQMLKEHSVYRAGYTEDSKTIETFWKVLESMSPQEHQLFLRFTWGRSRLPLFDDQFTQEFKIAKLTNDQPDKTLPLSHTCFFELELPEYTSFDVMKEKLIYAITECEAIDTDFNPTNADIWNQ